MTRETCDQLRRFRQTKTIREDVVRFFEHGVPKFCLLVCIVYICGYGSIPINTVFSGMNIHLPAILMFTRGTRFWHIPICLYVVGVFSPIDVSTVIHPVTSFQPAENDHSRWRTANRYATLVKPRFDIRLTSDYINVFWLVTIIIVSHWFPENYRYIH